MLILGTMEEESMMNTMDSRPGLQAASDTRRLPPALAATLPGMSLLFEAGMALANSDSIHGAAHDTRHSAASPCR